MATNIFNYDGSLLTSVQDGTIDTTHCAIRFPGKGYLSYGEAVNENMLWIMQNFASASAPPIPIVGQLWYDTVNQIIKVYNGTTWVASGGVIESATPPGGANPGALWFDTTNKQLNVWSGTNWLIVGPLGSSVNTDPINPAIPSYSSLVSVRLSDGVTNHQAWEIVIGGSLFAIISKDNPYSPSPSIAGFPLINPGINFNNTVSNVSVTGDTSVFRNNQNNLPNTDNTWNMGSNSYRFQNMYAVTFNGVATSAQYADIAERYEADAEYEPATVMAFGGEKEVTLSTVKGSSDVFGVVSTAPALIMNDNNKDMPQIGLLGRVPCKVVGKVRKGQRLMASNQNGAAEAWDASFGPLAILGRSMSNKETDSLEIIEIFVGKN